MQVHPDLNWINLTPEPGHFTFGYYDRCPWDSSNEHHLALRIPQQTWLPRPGEKAAVGYVERGTLKFHQVAETEAWCHQQGAMTLWLKHRPKCFIYNDYIPDEKDWTPVARIYDLDNGLMGQYDVPIYAVSNDGKWGISLNFGRIPRQGYSYARSPVPKHKPYPDLDKDGLFVVDMVTGESKLAASYRSLIEAHPIPHDLEGMYLWLNHAIFNCDSTRILLLFRYQELRDKPGGWKTYMYTMNLDGSDLVCSLPHIYWRHGAISHQIWGRTRNEILVDADWCDRGHEYIVFDETVHPIRAEKISDGMGQAGHLVFSPDSRWIAADCYPRDEGKQRLALVDASSGEVKEVGRFRHATEGATGDMRCDLHPRWSEDSSLLTVDTIHEGDRKIYMLEVKEAVELLFS